jgi:hypothetical protein
MTLCLGIRASEPAKDQAPFIMGLMLVLMNRCFVGGQSIQLGADIGHSAGYHHATHIFGSMIGLYDADHS